MIARTTTGGTHELIMRNVSNAQTELARLQTISSSGKNIQTPSDDPVTATIAMTRRAELLRNEQLTGRNIERAKDWLNTVDTASQSAVELMTEARTLLIQANSGALDGSGREAVANRLTQIRANMLAVANTTIDGRSIFAGTANTAAYSASGAYQGDDGVVNMPVAKGLDLQVNRTGPTVFGVTNTTEPTSGNVFQLLDHLATAVRSNDSSAISAGIGKVDTANQRIQTAQTELGSRLAQVEGIQAAGEARQVSLKSEISSLEDADMGEVILKLKAAEMAYQASLQASAKVLNTSLLDYLR